MKEKEKTLAALVKHNKILVGCTYTAATNGEIVSYGHALPDGKGIHEVGRAKISRAKKWLRRLDPADTLFEPWLLATCYDVNRGGGPVI